LLAYGFYEKKYGIDGKIEFREGTIQNLILKLILGILDCESILGEESISNEEI